MSPRKVEPAETKAPKAVAVTPLDAALQGIVEARAALEQHIRERERCSRAAAAHDALLRELDALHAEREAALAAAFADNIAPVLADVDKRIQEHEKRRDEMLRERDVARAATGLLDRRVAAARVTLNEHREAARVLVRDELDADLDALEDRWGSAIEGLGSLVAQFTALDAAYREVTGRSLPGRSDMRRSLYGIATLRCRWRFSALRDPAVAKRYDETSYKHRQLFAVHWLDPNDESFAKIETAELRTRLRLDALA